MIKNINNEYNKRRCEMKNISLVVIIAWLVVLSYHIIGIGRVQTVFIDAQLKVNDKIVKTISTMSDAITMR